MISLSHFRLEHIINKPVHLTTSGAGSNIASKYKYTFQLVQQKHMLYILGARSHFYAFLGTGLYQVSAMKQQVESESL